MSTAIEWTDAVWNPVTGCSKVSEGCRNCYAFALHDMRHKAFLEGKKLPEQYAKPFNKIQLFPERLIVPLKWKKPRRVFVNSMADLFHPDVPFDFIDKVFAAIALSPKHTFQILTKRPERMNEYMNTPDRDETIGQTAMLLYEQFGGKGDCSLAAGLIHGPGRATSLPGVPDRPTAWPIPNAWLGTSVENQKAADERIPFLLETPAAVRFLSCEPLLGPVDLEFITQFEHPDNEGYGLQAINGLDWVIVGGESGTNARPMRQSWVEGLRDQCQEYGVAFFFKQWGEFFPHEDNGEDPEFWVTDDGVGFVHTSIPSDDDWDYMNRIGKKRSGRLLDGQEWNEFPGAI